MADRTLTINNADGSSETYTINRDKFEGVRSMLVAGQKDGNSSFEILTVDHTKQDDIRTLIADGETITIDTTPKTGFRTLTVDGVEMTIGPDEAVVVQSFIEQFTAPKLAFSLRDLATTTGETTVVDVRRSAGDTAAFTAAEVADGTLTTWVGAGNEGFVSKWYDQSGNNHHAFQSNTAKQPKIVDANGLIEGGLDFNDAEALATSDTFTFPSGTTLSSFVTNKAEAATQNSYALSFAGNYILWKIGSGIRRITAGANATFGTISADEELWSVISTLDSSGGTSNAYVDGVLASSANVNHGTKVVSPARNFTIGGLAASSHWIGTINEVIVYDSDQSANLDAINANITDKYSI